MKWLISDIDFESAGWQHPSGDWLRECADRWGQTIARRAGRNTKQAVAEFETALRLTTDAKARANILEHAVAIDDIRRGLLERRPQDPDLRAAIARYTLRRKMLRGARAQLEKALSLDPGDAGTDSELAKLFLHSVRGKWTMLKPTQMKSDGGATLTLQKDGSILAGGVNPHDDRYSIRAQPDLARIFALKLETMPDRSLPRGGSGRDRNGSFFLHEIMLGVANTQDGGTVRPIRFRHAVANHSRSPSSLARNAIDGNLSTHWDPWPQNRKPLRAVFSTDEPADVAGKTLVIQLVSKSTWPNSALGRFRLSATSDPSAFAHERLRNAIEKGEIDGLSAFAAAYHLSGNPTALDKFTSENPKSLSGLVKVYAELALVKVYAELADRKRASDYFAKFLQSGGFPSAMVFDGKTTSVTATHVPFDTFDAFTVEAWMRGWQGRILQQGVNGQPEHSIHLAYGPNAQWKYSGWESNRGRNHEFELPYDTKSGWRHVAMIYDGKRQRFFVDGRLVKDRPAPAPGPLLKSRELTLGGRGAQGLMGSVRISSVARYVTDFTPSKELKSDAQTVLLYDLSQTKEGRLRDQSGNGRHGTIHGSRWIVNADPTKAILPKTVTPESAKK